MQKESWNIHGTKILICSITLNGTESYPSLEQKRTEGYAIVSRLVLSTVQINEIKYCVIWSKNFVIHNLAGDLYLQTCIYIEVDMNWDTRSNNITSKANKII